MGLDNVYYRHLRDKAAIKFMEAFITNGLDSLDGKPEDNQKYVARISISCANTLMKELKNDNTDFEE